MKKKKNIKKLIPGPPPDYKHPSNPWPIDPMEISNKLAPLASILSAFVASTNTPLSSSSLSSSSQSSSSQSSSQSDSSQSSSSQSTESTSQQSVSVTSS